ncbi:hypothetical protein A2U01_0077395, partial [Trifolium medium]|nr:hypothetical protein [Trifolium medium]
GYVTWAGVYGSWVWEIVGKLAGFYHLVRPWEKGLNQVVVLDLWWVGSKMRIDIEDSGLCME